MPGYGRGIGYLKEQQEKFGGGGDRIPKMWYKPGDVAKGWFGAFTDEDFLVPLMHIVKKFRMKDHSSYNADVLCGRETTDDPKEQCEVCMSGEGQGPFPRLVSWFFTEAVVHPAKPAKGGENWEQVKVGNSYMWMEKPMELRLFIMKTRLIDQVEAHLRENGTMADRRYKLQITGEGQSRTEVLIPEGPSEMPAEIRAAFQNAMTLEAAMQQEFGQTAKKTVTVGSGDGFAGDDGLPASDGGGFGDVPNDAELIKF